MCRSPTSALPAAALRPRPTGLLALLLLTALPVAAREGGGADGPDRTLPSAPTPLRILAPIHGLFFQFTPDSAVGPGAGASALRIELSESNMLQFPKSFPAQTEPRVDFEMTRLQVAWERGLSDRWDVGVEVPLVSFHEGWMDEPILHVEQFFDKVKPRREQEAPHGFDYRIARNGEVLFAGEQGGVALGDVGLTSRYLIERGAGGRPTVALRAALKLPTGERDRATGSGRVDLALGLVADWHAGRWSVWSSGSLTLPLGDVRNTPGFDTEPVGAGYLELGYSVFPRIRLRTQLAFQSGPFDLDDPMPETGLPVGPDHALTHAIVQVTPALSWRLGRDRTLFVGLVQDVNSSERSAPDASVFAVLKLGWR